MLLLNDFRYFNLKYIVGDNMEKCATCGNTYDKLFEIKFNGKNYFFDCFECAIQKLAPCCAHCNCKIIGHGVENSNVFYCCANCAREEGGNILKDRG